MKYIPTLDCSGPISAPAVAVSVGTRSIEELSNIYDTLERQCDVLIERQEAISRAMFRTNTGSAVDPSADAFPEAAGEVMTASGELKPRADIKFSDITPDDFRKLAQAARKSIHRESPFGKKRFILNACSLELGEIDEIEIQIMVYQLNMKDIEGLIMERVPQSVKEVVSKMRFIVGLMLDGQELDSDYFAYQIEECADVLSTSGL